MTTIVTRIGKGTDLTFAEVEANWTNLNNAIIVAQATADLALYYATLQFTSSHGGIVSASGGGSVNYLNASNAWTPPPGTSTATSISVDAYVTPGSYTWTKPASAKICKVYVVGGGGGGGQSGGFASYRSRGGSGGGGGAYIQAVVPADSLSATESVSVGAGGLAGTGGSWSFPVFLGGDGGAGGNSSFAGITAYGGGGGDGGTNSACNGGGGAGAAGAGGTPTAGAFGGSYGGLDANGVDNYNPIGGAGGAGPNTDAPGREGGRAIYGGQGGASGGGGVEYATVFDGGDAYEWGFFATPTVVGGSTTVDPTRNGGTVSGLAPSLRGAGGGGGAGCYTGTAGAGGAGQAPGGGGGGAGGFGGSGGPNDGGVGGNGIVLVVTYS